MGSTTSSCRRVFSANRTLTRRARPPTGADQVQTAALQFPLLSDGDALARSHRSQSQRRAVAPTGTTRPSRGHDPICNPLIPPLLGALLSPSALNRTLVPFLKRSEDSTELVDPAARSELCQPRLSQTRGSWDEKINHFNNGGPREKPTQARPLSAMRTNGPIKGTFSWWPSAEEVRPLIDLIHICELSTHISQH